MMPATFGIYNALEEYMELSGDDSMKGLAKDFADRAMPRAVKPGPGAGTIACTRRPTTSRATRSTPMPSAKCCRYS